MLQKACSVHQEVVDIDDENLMDAVTAVSVWPCICVLSGRSHGTGSCRWGWIKNSDEIARQTVIGAGQLMAGMRQMHLPCARTSPLKGTTAAALSVLMADEGLSPLDGEKH